MEVKFGIGGMANPFRFSMRATPDFASTTSKRKQAPERARIFSFQPCFLRASARTAVEARTAAATAAKHLNGNDFSCGHLKKVTLSTSVPSGRI